MTSIVVAAKMATVLLAALGACLVVALLESPEPAYADLLARALGAFAAWIIISLVTATVALALRGGVGKVGK